MARKEGTMGHREPNGRHQRTGEPAPVAVRRLLDAALWDVSKAEWATELGRLLLQQTITETMYVAGKKWAGMAEQYKQSIGVPRVKPQAFEIGRGGEVHLTEAGTKRDRELAKRMLAADKALVDAGPGVRVTVRRVCEDNDPCTGFDDLVQLRSGLMRLISHWNLTNQKIGTNVKSIR